MEKIKLRKEKVCFQYVGTVGDERRFLAVINALVLLVLLCCIRFCFRYCAIICYYGCYCCNYIWMPPLGNILDYIVTSFYAKKIMQFQIYISRRYEPRPTIFWVSPEKFISKSGLGNFGAKGKNGG